MDGMFILSLFSEQDVADLNHSKFDCLCVAILTHGVSGKFYSTDGELITIEEVTS